MRCVLGILVLLAPTMPGWAHEGPPFEILSAQMPPYSVSVWSDPDIGVATFFVVLEPQSGRSMADPDSVVVAVQPVTGRLPEAAYRAEPQRVRFGARYYTEAYLDEGEMWSVRVRVWTGGRMQEAVTEVEATPDGTIGPIGLIVYLLPFLAVGFLWLKAHLRRREISGR